MVHPDSKAFDEQRQWTNRLYRIASATSLMVGVGIVILLVAGLLRTPLEIAASALIGLLIVSSLSLWVIERSSRLLGEKIRKQQPIFVGFKVADQLPADNPISERGNREVSKIKAADERKKRGEEKEEDRELLEVLCRQGFREILSLWDSPDVVATFHAMESVRDLLRDWHLERELIAPIQLRFFGNEAVEKSVVRSRFDDAAGCWYSSDKQKGPSLEAAFAAVRIAYVTLLARREPCTTESLKRVLGADRVEKFEQFLQQCRDLKTGGFRGTADKTKKPDVANTGLAVRISNILYNEGSQGNGANLSEIMNEKLGFSGEATPSEYLLRCCKETEIDGQRVMAFAPDHISRKPQDEELFTCISYFAVASLKRLGMLESLPRGFESGMSAFLERCLKEDSTVTCEPPCLGYAADPKFTHIDIMHTHYCLKLSEIALPDYLVAKSAKPDFLDGIRNLLEACKTEEGGYAFRPGPNWAPNVYASCQARHLSLLLSKLDETTRDSFDPMEALGFYISCFNGSAAGFSGYPQERPTQIEI